MIMTRHQTYNLNCRHRRRSRDPITWGKLLLVALASCVYHSCPLGVVPGALVVAAEVATTTETTTANHDDSEPVDVNRLNPPSKVFFGPFYIVRQFIIRLVSSLLGIGGGPSTSSIAAEPQALQVIGAGLGRCATSSFNTALSQLGLRSYHSEAALLGADLKLWAALATHRVHRMSSATNNDGSYEKDQAMVQTLMLNIAKAGYNATNGPPTAGVYQELMNQYPNAKVVLLVRGHDEDVAAEKWATSYMKTVGQFVAILENFPFFFLPPTQQMFRLKDWYLATANMTIWRDTGKPDKQELIDAYKGWSDQIKATVPAERLLVFSPSDGWKPLCDFLMPLGGMVERRCEQILRTNESYPHVNDASSFFLMLRLLKIIEIFFKTVPFWLMVLLYRRRQKAVTRADGDKSKSE